MLRNFIFILFHVCWMRHWREIWRTGKELMIVAGNLVCLLFFAAANFQLDTNISLCWGGNVLPTLHTSDRGSTSPVASSRLATLFYTLAHKVSLRAVSINLYANKTPGKLREYTSTRSVFVDKHLDKNDDIRFTA